MIASKRITGGGARRGHAWPRLGALLVGLALAGSALSGAGCLPMPPQRSAATMKALRAGDAGFSITAPCTPAAAHAAVTGAGEAMSLEVVEASPSPGSPFILRRGRRLADGPFLLRVDVEPVPGRARSALVRVYAAPVTLQFGDTTETVVKPGALAMRIVAACVDGGAR